MTKKLYIIRHGQTDFNKRGIVQGRGIDSSINEVGQQQAKAFYNSYKHILFDKIYVSSLVRTFQTVESFIADGIPFEKLSGLDEINWGEYEGKDLTDELLSGFDTLVSDWKNDNLDARLANGESPNQLVKRQQEAMEHIMRAQSEKNVLICTHGRAMRVLLCYLTDTPVCKMDDFEHTNTGLYVLEHAEDTFEIIDHFNTSHLKEIACHQ